MYRKIALVVALVAMCGTVLTSASDIVDLGPQITAVEMGQNDRGDQVIQVTVSEVRLDAVEIDGQQWAVPRVPEGSNLMERSLPSLPFLESLYLLGRTDGIELRLTGVETTEIDLGALDFSGVAPSKGHFDRSIDPDSVPWTFDPDVYSGGKPFPSGVVWVDAPTIAGPWRSQSFRIPVATWDATTNILTVVEQATFAVIPVAEASNPRLGPDRAPTTLFGSMAGAVNASVRNTRSTDPGRLLILAYDDFIDEVQPLADWETLVGYPTLLTPLSTVASTPTATQIMAYIQGLYDSPEGLASIILVGDYAQIPNFQGDNENADCDPCYTKLEGNDNLPDASISRISAQNGADVTIQVDKILHYEQQPDTGGAATWYDHAFGIAGDDSGGSPSYYDWERMDFLRDVLIDPEYTFTEFDQLYHSPSKAQVTASIENGTSVGFYIGHGSDTSWVTSGYSVNDVHGLVNGEMLPVIWSVACVNGNFRYNNECFAESWLRQEGGGAVLFEGATTNESWVPPCDAQRGFVDAIRLETDFTVGAQHIAGKIECMTTNGSNDSSEGNKFMEQSHLFGSSVLWPRTVEPMAIETPENFSVGGGVASLTVEVADGPLTKAGAAIVNFYTTDGNTITSVGSGLIDATGTVQAAVSAEPTHCHIHGHNLIPQSFELAAQNDGRVNLDSAVYSCSSTAAIRVADANAGSSAGSIDTLNVDVSAGGAPISVVLTESGADTGFYDGTVVLGTDLMVGDGDTLTVTYQDAETGSGPQTKTATATIDCVPPGIGAIQTSADHESLTISFFTDEPGTTLIRWGTTTPPTTLVADGALVDGAHTVTIEGLAPCARIFFEVGSTDAVGNTTLDTNGGAFYSADTLGWSVYFEETMDADPMWTIDNGSSINGWEFGAPQGLGGANYGQPDPASGSTGDNVYGVNLDGDYDNNLGDNQLKLTTPAIDLSEATAVQLSYRQWLNVESPTYDHARVQVSIDGGGSWTTVWENDGEVTESAWSEQTIDLTSIAVGQSDVRIRWTQGSTDSGWQYAGWNIDDVRLEGSAPCAGIGSLFVDGFESGSCGEWSMEIGGQ